ncbi:hypothetical protein GCM10009621_05310 [Corynebacterium felinum]
MWLDATCPIPAEIPKHHKLHLKPHHPQQPAPPRVATQQGNPLMRTGEDERSDE